MTLTIAIDGPAAAGKSTAARGLAKKLQGLYVNTGDMYRTVAWAARSNHIDPRQEPQKLADKLKDWTLKYQKQQDNTLVLCFNGRPVRQEDIRAPEVADIVSYVAQIPEVRTWMTQKQRDCALLDEPIVMEGRDIGTVILPHATRKFFVTASPMERARRRFAQAGEVKEGATLQQVAEDIAKRDHIDSTRKVAPLKPAEDAITIMTDGMNPEQVVQKLMDLIQQDQAR